MSQAAVTKDGLRGERPGRQALVGSEGGHVSERPGRQALVGSEGGHVSERPGRARVEPTFGSYYGKPVLNGPVWHTPDIPAYFFLGGLAGASSVLALGARARGFEHLERTYTTTAALAVGGSLACLVHDLGRPARFLNMLRVLKVTSPMSVGSWVLAAYAPLATAAAASRITGRLTAVGTAAAAGAAALGPAMAAYSAALISNTAVPAWHDASREMPYVFVAGAAASAGGLGMLGAPIDQAAPARRAAVLGVLGETVATTLMERRIGLTGEPYRKGRSGWMMRAAKGLMLAGAAGTVLGGRRNRAAAAASGALVLSGSALLRFAVFEAGKASADDPRYVVVPQRERLEATSR